MHRCCILSCLPHFAFPVSQYLPVLIPVAYLNQESRTLLLTTALFYSRLGPALLESRVKYSFSLTLWTRIPLKQFQWHHMDESFSLIVRGDYHGPLGIVMTESKSAVWKRVRAWNIVAIAKKVFMQEL